MAAMFLFYVVAGGLYGCGLASATTDYPYTVTRAGYDVNITMNPANVSYLYLVWVNGSEAVKLFVVIPRRHRAVVLNRIWVLNSSHTRYTTRIRYTGEDSPSQIGQLRFTIYNVTVQDAGTYYCQGNGNQIIPGCRQVLVVSQKPTTPAITGPASAVSGENVTLTCSSSSRSLPPDHPPLTMTYTWRRNRTLLESGDGPHTGVDDLTITHISRENQGDIYTCQAVEEGLESDWSHGHVLEVHYGPDQIEFSGASDRLKAVEGHHLTVRCSADCNPACTVTWWDTSRQRVITGQREAVLYIPAVDRSVSGQYTCHVNNIHGSTSRNLTLEVFYGPDQIQFNASGRLKAEEGKPTTVRCSADCNPACTVTWWDTSRQRMVTGQREAVLYIPAVERSVSGQYMCHVNNIHGITSRNLTLEVFSREVTEASNVFLVPVAAVCSVLIVVIAVVVIVVVCRKQTRKGRGYFHNRVVTYTRDTETDGSYQEIEEGGNINNRVVSYTRDESQEGSYQEIEEDDVNVDDIVPVIAVYSVMLTAVAVLVAAVAILVCKDEKDDQDIRCGEYLTVVGERLSCDISAAINDEDASSLHDYERLLREQFHIYTSLHPSASSTEDHSTR